MQCGTAPCGALPSATTSAQRHWAGGRTPIGALRCAPMRTRTLRAVHGSGWAAAVMRMSREWGVLKRRGYLGVRPVECDRAHVQGGAVGAGPQLAGEGLGGPKHPLLLLLVHHRVAVVPFDCNAQVEYLHRQTTPSARRLGDSKDNTTRGRVVRSEHGIAAQAAARHISLSSQRARMPSARGPRTRRTG